MLSEAFILSLIGATGGLITLIFQSMRKSRCGDVACCCGMVKCKRDILTAEELKLEPQSPIKV